MAETIDWRAPLDFNIVFEDVGEPMKLLFVEVETTDGKSINSGGWHKRNDGLWELRIRNRKPAPQYPVDEVRKLCGDIMEHFKWGPFYNRAKAILADLPQPVDPDRQEADRLADEYGIIGCEKQLADEIHAAIKRVRAEKG